MNAWAKKMGISNVKIIPDGSGLFTKYMGMLISKDHDGFGQRSWRYMAVINDGIVEKWWQEPGINNSGSENSISSPFMFKLVFNNIGQPVSSYQRSNSFLNPLLSEVDTVWTLEVSS